MSTATIFNKVAFRVVNKRKALEKRWADAVVLIADNKPPTPEAIETLLEDCEKTVEQLQQGVHRLTERRKAFGAVERSKTIATERSTAVARLQASEAIMVTEIETAKRKYDEAAAPLKAQLAELNDLERAGSQGAAFLMETHEDEDGILTAEIAAAEGRVTEARNHLGAANHEAHKAGIHLNDTAAVYEQMRYSHIDAAWRAKLDRDLAAAEEREKKAREGIPALRVALAEAESDLKKTLDKCLAP